MFACAYPPPLQYSKRPLIASRLISDWLVNSLRIVELRSFTVLLLGKIDILESFTQESKISQRVSHVVRVDTVDLQRFLSFFPFFWSGPLQSNPSLLSLHTLTRQKERERGFFGVDQKILKKAVKRARGAAILLLSMEIGF